MKWDIYYLIYHLKRGPVIVSAKDLLRVCEEPAIPDVCVLLHDKYLKDLRKFPNTIRVDVQVLPPSHECYFGNADGSCTYCGELNTPSLYRVRMDLIRGKVTSEGRAEYY